MTEPDSSPEWLIMEANIREFGATISMICALETGGKISPDEAYAQIKAMWKKLKVSRDSLLGNNKPPRP